MKIRVVWLTLAVALAWPCAHATGGDLDDIGTRLSCRIPDRPAGAATGSEFARQILELKGPERERAIRDELVKGNLPSFLRNLKPVRLEHRFEDGTTCEATIFVMPDYLAIGSDSDFVWTPMDRYTATEVAADFGFILPTPTMVDAIYEQADVHLRPQPMPPCPQMCSTPYYLKHCRKIEEQRLALHCSPGCLVSGHKKDVVLSNRLTRAAGKIAIYGWHRLSGVPIQPLSTVHQATYADYSHGIRLVSGTVLINGQPRSIYQVLKDPRLAKVLSQEGPIPSIRTLMTPPPQPTDHLAATPTTHG